MENLSGGGRFRIPVKLPEEEEAKPTNLFALRQREKKAAGSEKPAAAAAANSGPRSVPKPTIHQARESSRSAPDQHATAQQTTTHAPAQPKTNNITASARMKDPDPDALTLREAQPVQRPYAPAVFPQTLLVHPRQKGNPVLAHIRNVKWTFGDIMPDFQMGAYTAGLYLSLRYHLLHPEYLDVRIRELQREFRLRVLFVFVDVDDADLVLMNLTKLTLANKVTMILTWSMEEAARYIETYKAYENKPADIIQGTLGDADYHSQLCDVLTCIRSINKTDVLTLASTFGSLQAVMNATFDELLLCPGLGDKKVQRIYDAFHNPID